MKSMFKILCSLCAWGGVFLILAGCPADDPQTVAPQPVPVSGELVIKRGAAVTTFGWADTVGMKYPNTDNIIEITDEKYPTAAAKREAFTNAIASGSVSSSSVNTAPAIIILDGTVDLSDGKISDTDHTYYDEFNSDHTRKHDDIVCKIGSNKAIIGKNNAKIAFGGLQIYAKDASSGQNIIIQNVTFWDAHGSTEKDTKYDSSSKASADALVLEATKGSTTGSYDYIPTNIWIDHCTFTDGTCSDLIRNLNHDGSLDMKAAKNVTVSWCEFTNHDKVTLLAPGDDYVNPEDRQITFHHNYYHGATQRMPRSRGCQLHIYNNVYDDIGVLGNGGYSLGPGIGSQYIVENNYFGSFKQNIVQYEDSSEAGAATLSKFYQTGNNITISNSDVKNSGLDFATYHNTPTPPWTINYPYKDALQSYAEAAAAVKKQAGGAYYTTVTVE
ncbi:MAG: polysaccharide lyase family 1 protein [Bacteroides sp.]|nr:polysaccharide lyase family 1 protein [Prevotella sp.]MCM1406905.1 polysaccharide lyase family 1 protein [Treponema brennaborense]MCM1470056.1 polysaccharide lyase family 1 protein [Bacteroides sp.]